MNFLATIAGALLIGMAALVISVFFLAFLLWCVFSRGKKKNNEFVVWHEGVEIGNPNAMVRIKTDMGDHFEKGGLRVATSVKTPPMADSDPRRASLIGGQGYYANLRSSCRARVDRYVRLLDEYSTIRNPATLHEVMMTYDLLTTEEVMAARELTCNKTT